MSTKMMVTAFAGLLFPLLIGNFATAAIVQFDFVGTVTNRFNNGLPDPSDIFGLSVEMGDAVTGSFTIDTSVTPFLTIDGAIGGSAAGYMQMPPLGISVNLAGGVFSSDGNFSSATVNEFQNDAMFPPSEQFGVSDGVSSGTQDVSGDTILLDGSPETARLAITFTDFDLTAFSSTMLPTSLDLSQFEISEGTVSGTRPSGQANPFFYQAAFRIDSITATAIPEPSAIAFLGCITVTASLRRKRCNK